jgi:diguanylate cyclase (GGDEF)-like protein
MIDTLPHRAGVGAIRRYAASVFGRRPTDAAAALRLRGALPLRYPGDRMGLEYDPLTGLATQPVFAAALRRCVASSARADEPVSLVLLDVDDLGETNQRHGYVTGDELLRRAADAIRDHAGPDDRSFRLGGDEFALLMPTTGSDEAALRASAIVAAFGPSDTDIVPGSLSAGVAGGRLKTRQHDALYLQASAALLDVKRRGRGGVATFDAGRHALAQPTVSAGLELVERVIAGRLLRPVFQPIIDLRSGHALGFEGLVRVQAGSQPPGASELFAAADAVDRVAELDLACIDAVVGGARSIRPDRLLTLNLSPRTLAGRAFEPAWLLERLLHAGISPSRVVVELSDDVAIEDLAHLRTTVHELQRLGLRLAADDVTVDDSNQHLLTHLPFDIVKIDLTRIWEGAQTGPRLAGLRDFAYSRNARVVAEGVETSEQLVAVRDLEFGAAQGYLLGRPDASAADRVVELERLQGAPMWAPPAPLQQPAGEPEDPLEALPLERLATLLSDAPVADVGVAPV